MSEQTHDGEEFTSAHNRLGKLSPDDTGKREKYTFQERYYVRRVVEIVSDYSGISPSAILGRSQIRIVSHPRNCVAYILRNNPYGKQFQSKAWSKKREYDGLSSTAIGYHLNRDHTTILSGLRCFEKWISRSIGVRMKKVFDESMEQLRSEGLS